MEIDNLVQILLPFSIYRVVSKFRKPSLFGLKLIAFVYQNPKMYVYSFLLIKVMHGMWKE